jgi:hypothetical protein
MPNAERNRRAALSLAVAVVIAVLTCCLAPARDIAAAARPACATEVISVGHRSHAHWIAPTRTRIHLAPTRASGPLVAPVPAASGVAGLLLLAGTVRAIRPAAPGRVAVRLADVRAPPVPGG